MCPLSGKIILVKSFRLSSIAVVIPMPATIFPPIHWIRQLVVNSFLITFYQSLIPIIMHLTLSLNRILIRIETRGKLKKRTATRRVREPRPKQPRQQRSRPKRIRKIQTIRLLKRIRVPNRRRKLRIRWIPRKS